MPRKPKRNRRPNPVRLREDPVEVKQELRVMVTPQQEHAILNMLSGKFKSKAEALVDAGYSEAYARTPSRFFGARSVQDYIVELDRQLRKRDKKGRGLYEKVMKVFEEGLDATKPYGKEGQVHPDYLTRLRYAEAFAQFFKWSSPGHPGKSGSTGSVNFNFFDVPPEKRRRFNKMFKGVVQALYREQGEEVNENE